MAKDFGELAERVATGWSDDARAVHDAASAVFEAEAQAREDLGAQVAAARRSLQLTQPKLAELSGVQQAEISRIERGVANPTVTTLSHLARALGLRLGFSPAAA